MLKKKYRLKKTTAFSATFRLKNCKSNEFLAIYIGKPKANPEVPTKIGIIVSKKVHKRAVKRNKIKRRLREIYIEAVKTGIAADIQESLSVIFIARIQILNIEYKQLKQAVFELLEQFKI